MKINLSSCYEHLSLLHLDPENELHTTNFSASNYSSVLPFCNRVYIPKDIFHSDWTEIKKFYGALPYTLWIDEENSSGNKTALEAGFKFKISYPLMVADLQNISLHSKDERITVKQLNNKSDILNLWVSLVSAAYNISLTDFQKFIAHLLATPNAKNMRFYIGYYNGVPAATNMLILHNDTADMHWVGTLPEFRKNGLGYAVSCFPLHLEKKEINHAILYSSDMGKSVYENIGFVEKTRCNVYVPEPEIINIE